MQKFKSGSDEETGAEALEVNNFAEKAKPRYLEMRIFSDKPLSKIIQLSGKADIHDLAGSCGVKLVACIEKNPEEIGLGIFGNSRSVDEFRDCLRSLSN